MKRFVGHLALIVVVGLALSGSWAPAFAASTSSPARSAAAAAPQPTPIVAEAFQRLMDFFVTPPKSGDLLGGGWDAAVAAIKDAGGTPPANRPELTNARTDDWYKFLLKYPALLKAAEGLLEQDALDQKTVAGMASSLNENHTRFIGKDLYKDTQAAISNNVRYAGIGARFNRDLVVMEVFDGSPAQEGGLQPGDQLISVDGESVEGLTPSDASKRVRGEPGTLVTLRLRRDVAADPLTLPIVRREIKLDWLVSKTLDEHIGYLTIRSFPTTQAIGPFNEALSQLSNDSIYGLIIDLRNNSGGSVDMGEKMLDRFIKDGPIYQRVDRRGGQRTVSVHGDFWGRSIPIAVLIDGGSGSMSEVFAAAMQENGAARLIGKKTAGSVAASVYHQLSDGSALQIAHSLIKSGKGKVLDNEGVAPDEEVDLDTAALRQGRDTQRQAALEYIRHQVAMGSGSEAGLK